MCLTSGDRAADGGYPREVPAIAAIHRPAVHLHLVAGPKHAIRAHAHAVIHARPAVDLGVVVEAVRPGLHERLVDGDLQQPLVCALVDVRQERPSAAIVDRHAGANDLDLGRTLDLRHFLDEARRVHEVASRERRLQAQVDRRGQVVEARNSDPQCRARQQFRQAPLELIGDHDVVHPRARGGIVPEAVGHQDGLRLSTGNQQEIRDVVQTEIGLVAPEIGHRALAVANRVRDQRVHSRIAHARGNGVGATPELTLGKGSRIAHRGLPGVRATCIVRARPELAPDREPSLGWRYSPACTRSKTRCAVCRTPPSTNGGVRSRRRSPSS